MRVSRRIFPFIQRVFADSGYGGGKTRRAASMRVKGWRGAKKSKVYVSHGSQTGGGGPKGMATMTTGKMTTTKTMDHNNRWRRLEFVGPGDVGSSYGCVYKRTAWGATRVCGDIY
jgi:hypothetical protein